MVMAWTDYTVLHLCKGDSCKNGLYKRTPLFIATPGLYVWLQLLTVSQISVH